MFEHTQTVMSEVIVPLHNNIHFVMLYIVLTSQERNNGKAFIYGYLGKGVNKRNLRAKIWWAKSFVIFYKKEVILNEIFYMCI